MGTRVPNWGATWEQCVTCLSVLEVVAPEWSDLVLATNVPHSEADVLVFHGFNVEPWLYESCMRIMMMMNVEAYRCIHNLTMASSRIMVTNDWQSMVSQLYK